VKENVVSPYLEALAGSSMAVAHPLVSKLCLFEFKLANDYQKSDWLKVVPSH